MKYPPMKLPLILAASVFVSACSKQDPATTDAPDNSNRTVELVCSYAPSQSAVVNHVVSIAGSSALAATAVAKAAGLTAVMHGSGAYIFTGASGYVAGTLGGAVAMPVIVTVGIVAGSTAATLELLCVPKNHQRLVARVEAAATEFVARSKAVVGRAAQKAESAATTPLVAKVNGVMAKAEEEIFKYANRTTVAVSDTLKFIQK